ncbi:MAG: hypothetical protein RSB82_04585 [Victivallaceae bacterium]
MTESVFIRYSSYTPHDCFYWYGISCLHPEVSLPSFITAIPPITVKINPTTAIGDSRGLAQNYTHGYTGRL